MSIFIKYVNQRKFFISIIYSNDLNMFILLKKALGFTSYTIHVHRPGRRIYWHHEV